MFGAEPNAHLFYEVAKMQQINRRRGTVGVKNTSLVSGGGKKPWKQKGTGRARQGSIRASHWVGGGKAMAPKARDYTYRPPRKVRRGALRAALSPARPGEDADHPRRASPSTRRRPSRPSRSLTKRLKLANALVVDEQEATPSCTAAVRNLAELRRARRPRA